jgi:hypothetical protein
MLDDVVLRGGMKDSDGDGMPDIWERRFGLMPDRRDDGQGDADEDGMNNAAEFRAGTHPRDSASRFQLRAEVENGVRLEWASVSNRMYTVLRAEGSLFSFEPIAQDIAPRPPTNSLFDTTATNSGPYFYRVFVE